MFNKGASDIIAAKNVLTWREASAAVLYVGANEMKATHRGI